MLTEKKIEKAITKHFNVENTILKLGKIKQHSNVCWEYVKNDVDMTIHRFLSAQFINLVEQGKITSKNLPFKNSIMNYDFKRVVICENKKTGFNLLKRYNVDEINIDIEKIIIDNDEFYIIY